MEIERFTCSSQKTEKKPIIKSLPKSDNLKLYPLPGTMKVEEDTASWNDLAQSTAEKDNIDEGTGTHVIAVYCC